MWTEWSGIGSGVGSGVKSYFGKRDKVTIVGEGAGGSSGWSGSGWRSKFFELSEDN